MYIEALRLNPQHVLSGVSQQCSLSYSVGPYKIYRVFPSAYHPTVEECGNRRNIVSPEPQELGVCSQNRLAGLESFVSVASSTGSDGSLNLSKQWLQNCDENHVSCSRNATTYPYFLPTRLVDIGIEEPAITPRLRLRKDIPPDSVYFTLSHCWAFKYLPGRIMGSPELGGRYIWIDSLCIVQDSETDWLVESASMCDVYSNSYCNICATAASDGSEGMFRDREPLQVQQGWFQTASDNENHCVIDVFAWEKEVEKGFLSSRAWVFQERLLSRRNLHFGSRQLFWECIDHEASETLPRGIPELVIKGSGVKPRVKVLFNGIDKYKSNRYSESVQIWEEIVTLYMKSNLTFKTDRLVAIGGMASAASQTIAGKYLAGVWEKHLLHGILWKALNYPSNLSKFTQAPLEVQDFTAPSWSWASFDA
ncbi:hypothetical protein BPOR_0850g00020 [Botrytis porri]|uniref:Heterokaryon incompatibility domain-containing protein n=2 Tax=Botrytis porri TaxID=87229 RepID=A0A4Z1K8D9_9HELO|nr:hypothetical protein BPOR_0850g00020 [Botrytis porri]